MAWRVLDGDLVGRRWADAKAAWWPKRLFAKRAVVKTMRNGGANGTPSPARDAAILKTLRTEGEAIDRLDKQLSVMRDWANHDTHPIAVEALRERGERARKAVGGLADDAHSLAETRGKLRTILQDGNDLLAPDAIAGRAATEFMRALETVRSAIKAFEERAGCDLHEFLVLQDHALKALREVTEPIIERRAELNSWCAWLRRRNEASDLDLGPLVSAIEEGRIAINDIPQAFDAAYCRWWSEQLIEQDEVLRTFSSAEHTDAIERFRRADSDFQKVTAAYVAANLSRHIPGPDEGTKSSQWGVLRHEINKKKRHKPVRQLMQEAPEVITGLAPCLMMSPLSVAQYLPPEKSLFDVVIFDEASQITVWDAVGSIARGRQTIIAGDPKQMPPTNFFNRSDDDPDGDVDYEGDLESILDELRSSSIPERILNLHYRSRRESLIAFSNERYYDNSLITFPAPIHPDRGVRLVRPDGFYARGQARHNQGEAKAIVAEVVRRLTSEDQADREATIGVVTFNSEQQSLIEDLLDKARSENPDIEWAFAEDCLEPVFVKNLETVQGDERDVILFSITYGPDQSGHITMNFGPLNRQGGERRLNVAMTRARLEMVVFSTLHPDKIDLSRTNAEAVKDLKHFLEFAERGPSALGARIHGSLGDFESPFEVAVARALRDKGWTLHPQIGVSAFRIDLGIVHPDEPGVYLAGVECDGAMYHSSVYARERDKIRQAVLEGLDWTLFRVWSTDWWINKTGALEELDRKLGEHLEADRARRATEAVKAETETNDATPSVDDSDLVTEGDDAPTQLAPAPMDSKPEDDQERAAILLPGLESNEIGAGDRAAVAHEAEGTAQSDHSYRKANLFGEQFAPDAKQFYEESYELRLIAMIDQIVDVEGPIHEDVLVRRIARHHGFQRSGRQIRELVFRLAKMRRGRTHEEVGTFFWCKGTVNDRSSPARYADRDDEMRNVEYIATEELRAIHASLKLGGDVLEWARSMGIARLSGAARGRLEHVLLIGGEEPNEETDN